MEANGRQYGIDIARLASMFMVVLLHNLLQGGVLDWTLDSMRDLLYMALEKLLDYCGQRLCANQRVSWSRTQSSRSKTDWTMGGSLYLVCWNGHGWID